MKKIDPAILNPLRCYLNIVIVVLIGTAFSIYVYRKAIDSRFERMMATFRQEAASLFFVLEDEFVLHWQQLESLRSFYMASQNVTENEFAEYVRPLMIWHPDVMAFLWIPLDYNGPAGSKYRFQEGYIVPSDPNLRTHHLLEQNEVTSVLDELMLKKDSILASDVHEPNMTECSSFLFICTPFSRGSQIEGFLACVLDVGRTASIVDRVTQRPITVSVSLEKTMPDSIQLENGLPVAAKTLELAGARILTIVRARPSYRKDFFSWQSESILMLGLFSTGLLGCLVFSQTRTRFKLEKLVKRRTRELLHKNEELEGIINVSYHDLKSPLVNISGFSHELNSLCSQIRHTLETSRDLADFKSRIAPVLREVPESVRFIESNVIKMNAVQDGLLQLAVLGRIELKIRQVEMNGFVTRLIDSLRDSIRQYDAAIFKEDLPNCYADQDQLGRVFSILIDNALKYRSPDRKPRIVISGKQTAHDVVYCVEDNGVGMNTSHAQKVFEPFQRLDPAGLVPGQGLGLATVKRLTILHGGNAWVETEIGKGSRFFVSLPRRLGQ